MLVESYRLPGLSIHTHIYIYMYVKFFFITLTNVPFFCNSIVYSNKFQSTTKTIHSDNETITTTTNNNNSCEKKK